jgi:hypothetical protein
LNRVAAIDPGSRFGGTAVSLGSVLKEEDFGAKANFDN